MIKLRIDVDYPYPSRAKSFLYTILGIKIGKDYLKNPKIIAKMINDSPKDVKAYWFFTPKTIPDKDLLELLSNSRHEIALHVANDPYKEWKLLEDSTGRKASFYTVHGTARFLARLMWRRFKVKVPEIPNDFPLQSFYKFPTIGLDIACYTHNIKQAVRIAEGAIARGEILHVHPEWLFQRGKMNQRGPFYETLRRILETDGELEALAVCRKVFAKIASDAREYEVDVVPTDKFIEKLGERGIDIFTFIERKWCSTIPNPSEAWLKANDNIALLHITSYDEWWKNIGKKTRNMIRKAEKNGVKTEVTIPNERFAEGVWRIYNETPIRQERAFPHYGTPLKAVKESMLSSQNCTFIGAHFQDELAGFIQLIHGNNTSRIAQMLSMQKHWDKAVNNALIAKAVEVCANKQIKWLIYGRMGNHPSLDNFKQNNGFAQFQLTRYYIPLTKKGKIATKLKLHREIKDALPQSVKYPLIPIYNWVSRTKAKFSPKPKRLT